MMHALAWFLPALRSYAVFGGGKAPACWSRDLARKTAGLTTMQQGGAWVEEFGAIRLKLCEGPLLGYTLAALTQQAGQTRESQLEPHRPGKARFSQWEKALERNQNRDTTRTRGVSGSRIGVPDYSLAAKRKASKETRSASVAKTPSQLQAQADRSLLSRLAGNKYTFEGAEPRLAGSSPMNRKDNVAFGGMEQEPTRSFSATEKTPFSSVCRDSASQQDWLSRLLQRVGRVMTPKQPDTTGMTKRAQDDAQIPGQSLSLQEQWAMLLDGTCVSLDLLNRFAKEDIPAGKGSSERVQRRSSVGQQTSLRNPLPLRPDMLSVLSDRWIGWQGETADGDHDLEPRIEPLEPTREDASFVAPEAHLSKQQRHSASESKSSTQISPSTITPVIPSLLPPRRAGVQPLPAAAATARQGADDGAMMATDDLDVLAAKIKQILDEQARRHGIDV
jgi:hypothetical protein